MKKQGLIGWEKKQLLRKIARVLWRKSGNPFTWNLPFSTAIDGSVWSSPIAWRRFSNHQLLCKLTSTHWSLVYILCTVCLWNDFTGVLVGFLSNPSKNYDLAELRRQHTTWYGIFRSMLFFSSLSYIDAMSRIEASTWQTLVISVIGWSRKWIFLLTRNS